MSGNCGVCNVKCIGEDSVKCADCENLFHTKCAGISSLTRGAKKDWTCESCRKSKGSKSSISSKSSDRTELTKEFLINILESFKTEMFAEIKTTSKQYEELKHSIEFLSNKVDESNKLMEEVRASNKEIKKENEELRQKNNTLTKIVSNLQVRMRNIEQYSRKNNVEISGVPATNGEDVLELVKDIGAAINLEVKREDIMAAHRVPSFRSNKSPPLIVQLQNRMLRDRWMKHFKDNKGVTAQQVNRSFPNSRIFISEHLTPEIKTLLRQVKDNAKQVGYQFVWVKEGKIFVRKKNGERCVRIDGPEDLDKLS